MKIDVVKENSVRQYLNLKDNELFMYYRNAPKEIQKQMDNVYKACYRFNLSNTQTLFMIRELLRPFRNQILDNMLK